MKKFFLFSFIFLISLNCFSQESVLFQFVHKKGDAFSHVSTVQEEAYLNGRLNSKTEFINRTSSSVLDILPDGAELLLVNYMTTQNSLIQRTGDTLSWGEEASVRIFRKKNGEMYDSDNLFLPTVRNIPSFPEKPVKPGETWQAQGLEVHDCRELFNMDEALSIPFTAKYEYSGVVPAAALSANSKNATESSKISDSDKNNPNKNSNVLHIVNVYYDFFQDNTSGQFYKNSNFAGASGYAKQKIYWDAEKNEIAFFEEEFQIETVDFYGNSFVFIGVSQGEVTEFKSVNDDENVQKLQNTVKNYNLKNINVTRGEKGLTLSIENIQFEPDSDVLSPSEQKKLEKIGEILKEFNNDLLITGHCAERGTESARQKLSEQRAKSVADFLIKNEIRSEYHVFTQGKGSTQPIASNATEKGRSRNRRVEITIMD